MTLRPYQRQAVDATWHILKADKKSRPLVVMPTGSGKSHVLAALAAEAHQKYGARTLILSHVKELLEQNAEKLRQAAPGLDVGLYSAGLNSRDTDHPVIVAGVQSVYKRVHELCDSAPFSLVVIDEAHLIPPDGDGMYRQTLQAIETINPRSRLAGFTATPFRTSTGLLVGAGQPFSCISYDASIKSLIADGFLCRPVTRGSNHGIETSGLAVRQGEFAAAEVEQRFLSVFVQSMNEMFAGTFDRKSVLVFCSGVDHANACCEFARGIYETAEVVTGETSPTDRDRIIRDFRSGRTRYLFNVNVLTTGFDATNCDAVILLRSTMSPGLYSQMVGRGFRLHPGKNDFLVMDFGRNVERHGPIDAIEIPHKEHGKSGSASEPKLKCCPQCLGYEPLRAKVCSDCGHEFEFKAPHEAEASSGEILSNERPAAVTYENRNVDLVEYAVHVKRNASSKTPRTLRVEYHCGYYSIREWICVEHDPESWAYRKALQWWQARCKYPMPQDADEACRIAELGALKSPQWVRIKSVEGDQWDSVEGAYLGAQPYPEVDIEAEAVHF